jgi:hypothetical protein
MVQIRSNLPVSARGCGLVIVTGIALFVGLMIATAGTAIYPRLAHPGAALICSGEVIYESHGASYRPGEYTVTREVYCQTGSGKGATRDDITFKAIGVAFLIYSAISFVLLILLGLLLKRRTRDLMSAPTASGAGWTVRTATTSSGDDTVATASGPASPADISDILAKVAEAVERGGPNVVVRNMAYDSESGGWAESDGGDDGRRLEPAERLARLKQLYDQGLISAGEYQTKRSEIISGL